MGDKRTEASRRPIKLSNGRLKDEYYAPFPREYFAPGSGHQALDIGIIGAGIAGLTCAIALAQCGHHIELFERSKFSNEIGAAVSLMPNSVRIMHALGFELNRGQPVAVHDFIFRDGKTSGVIRRTRFTHWQDQWDGEWLSLHRVDLHNELRRMAQEPRPGYGNPAKINLASEVVDLDLDGGITLVDGTKVMKDLLIAADGVRTNSAAKVCDPDECLRATPTGTAVHRFMIPTDKLLADEQTRHLFERDSTSQFAVLGDKRLVWYPCRGETLQNFGWFQPDRIKGYDNEIWNIPATTDEFMESCSGLHPDLQAVCAKAEDLKQWRLCARKEPIRTLTRGKIVLVGDAAHPMLPHQGQGAAMGFEDAACLMVLLAHLSSKDEIPARLELFQKLRIKRVSAMQIFSSVGQDEAHKIAEIVKPFVDGAPPKNQPEYHDYNYTPNVMRDTAEAMAEYWARMAES